MGHRSNLCVDRSQHTLRFRPLVPPPPRPRHRLLKVQWFISLTIGFLIVEMFAQYGYQAYLNSHAIDYWLMRSLDGRKSVTTMVRFLLILTSVLDAARNSLSFFLLLIVS